jgi:hypothetical protein
VTQHFVLEPNRRLLLSWSPEAKSYAVTLDGQPLGEVSAAEAVAGKTLQLPDGSALQLRGQALSAELELTHNGKPLREPTNWPPLVKNAGMVLLGIGALSLLVGLSVVSGASSAGEVPSWLLGVVGALGGGTGAIALGAAYLLCGYLSFRRVGAAMWAAGALMLTDTALTVTAAVQADQPLVGGLLARMVVLAAMVRGLQAVNGLKRQG